MPAAIVRVRLRNFLNIGVEKSSYDQPEQDDERSPSFCDTLLLCLTGQCLLQLPARRQSRKQYGRLPKRGGRVFAIEATHDRERLGEDEGAVFAGRDFAARVEMKTGGILFPALEHFKSIVVVSRFLY